MAKLDGRVVVVTGAASGIGAAIAELAGKEGAKVGVFDVDSKGADRIKNKIIESGGSARNYDCDVSDEASVEKAFGLVQHELGPVYGLVNNAGIGGVSRPTHEIKLEEWDAVHNINLRGTFLCTKHAIPMMVEQRRGSIVNISSTAGLVGGASSPYSSSKGAVRLLTKTDALHDSTYRIRINSVHPGSTNAPMAQRAAIASGDPDTYLRSEARAIPLGRLGKPSEIASVVVFLLSDDSSYMTGSEVVVDGGATIATMLEFKGSEPDPIE